MKIVILPLMLALVACAEVVPLRAPDGTPVYYVDCESTMPRLESCRAAIRRTCPNGAQEAQYKQSASEGNDDRDPAYDSCIADHRAELEAGEPSGCVRRRRNEAFFTCK